MKTTLFVCLFSSAFILRAQEKYSEIQIGSKYTQSEIQSAVQKANWCGYYHQNMEFKLQFDDGTFVYLKSRNQFIKAENVFPESCFQNRISESNTIFVIAENGNIYAPKSRTLYKSKN